MLRDSHRGCLQRIFEQLAVPAHVVVRSAEAWRCPDCRSRHEFCESFFSACHSLTPKWRFV
jgi:hypothetical protein